MSYNIFNDDNEFEDSWEEDELDDDYFEGFKDRCSDPDCPYCGYTGAL